MHFDFLRLVNPISLWGAYFLLVVGSSWIPQGDGAQWLWAGTLNLAIFFVVYAHFFWPIVLYLVLHKREGTQPFTKWVKIWCGYLVSLVILWFGLQTIPNSGGAYSIDLKAVWDLLVIASVLGTLLFAAWSFGVVLCSAEKKMQASRAGTLGTFLQIWFLPIGIFSIDSRLKALNRDN